MKSGPWEGRAQTEPGIRSLHFLPGLFWSRISAGNLVPGWGTGCGHIPWDATCCGRCSRPLFPEISHLCSCPQKRRDGSSIPHLQLHPQKSGITHPAQHGYPLPPAQGSSFTPSLGVELVVLPSLTPPPRVPGSWEWQRCRVVQENPSLSLPEPRSLCGVGGHLCSCYTILLTLHVPATPFSCRFILLPLCPPDTSSSCHPCHTILLPLHPPAIPFSCQTILLPSHFPATSSSCHSILLSPHSPATPSSCHPVFLPLCPPVIPSSCHSILLSPHSPDTPSSSQHCGYRG